MKHMRASMWDPCGVIVRRQQRFLFGDNPVIIAVTQICGVLLFRVLGLECGLVRLLTLCLR